MYKYIYESIYIYIIYMWPHIHLNYFNYYFTGSCTCTLEYDVHVMYMYVPHVIRNYTFGVYVLLVTRKKNTCRETTFTFHNF